MSFQDKVVIVTGAAHGIGKTVALTYAKKGANVVIADINEELGQQVTLHINNQDGGKALFVKTDVSSQHEIISLIHKIMETFGKIDIVINNAGISTFKSFYDVTIEEWDKVINTNLRSVFLVSQEAAKHMRLNKNGGAIVNIASTRAWMSEPNTECYSASKGGIVALTHSLAITLGEDKIKVNSVSPGWIEVNDYEELREIDHKQHPSGRVGRAEDIARACLYLTDEANDFVTGIDLVVDGGMSKKMIYEH
ncbi:glucose 1-dehydrogenase [Bacillus sp. PS06]|uniref:glucose 1-dehydrogenase n=1 Tax=Bacillus sp. PS06 TaxID=2764176 RepID=UPI0017839656|nr:glucose 1-dehydrogenase [Bacillus sp. PS06]MBD8067412.1 glucose 1-dehydrogenase [Bacillus sp. PS06]